MPGLVRPVHDERDALLAYLDQQRYALRLTAHGLTDDQARQTPTVSTLSVGGLVKHVTQMERERIDIAQGRPGGADGGYPESFRMGPDETLADLLEDYDAAARHTGEVVAAVSDLDQPVPVPRGVPWYPSDVDAWSLRWVLFHLIEETARHAGHADIVREAVDGATAFPLMAAAEGWPATPWLTPWRPDRTAADRAGQADT